MLRFLLLTICLLASSWAATIPDGCSCENGGTCRTDSPYCACPSGWTGATCDLVYESCHGLCQNNGKCWDGELDDFGNVQNFCACDRYHTGKYCQHTVIPVETGCNAQNQAEFCLNNGACNPGYYPDSKTTSPCLCPAGFTGDRCERTLEIHTPTTTNSNTLNESSTNDNDCDVPCQHGTCAFGQLISHPDGWDAPSDTMHCQCDDGFGGAYCELTAEQCGAHKCYNGGMCIKDDDTGLLHCDCAPASADNVYYAGQFCQYESNDYCGFHPEAGHLFCVNEGTCRADVNQGCDCPAEFDGFACEFKTSGESIKPQQMNDISECNLQCQNGGVCREGNPQLNDPNSYDAYHEHCVCPSTHTGPLCDRLVEDDTTKPTLDCGMGRHVCPNSEKCVAYGDELLCDCGTGALATFFEGQHCEQPTHDICTIGVTASEAQSYHQVVPTQQLSYCVNGGRCKSAVAENEPHPGCNCEEGFLGPHCELKESNPIPRVTFRAEDSSGEATSDQNIFRVGLGVVMFMVMSVFVVVLVHTARRRRKQRFNNEVTSSLFWSSGYTDEPQVNNIAPKRSSSLFMETPNDVYTEAVQTSRRDMAIEMKSTKSSVSSTTEPSRATDRPDDVPKLYIGPPRDEDGHELHNVEIV